MRLDEIPIQIWKINEFQDVLLISCNKVYEQDPIDVWNKGCIIPLPKKGDLSSTNNYRDITLTCTDANIYNIMLLNRIRAAVDKIRMVLEIIDLPLGKYLRLEELSKAQMQKADSYYPFH